MHAVSNTRATALFFTIHRPITDECPVERLPTARPGFSSSTKALLNYAVPGDSADGLSLGRGFALFGGEYSVQSRMNVFALSFNLT